MTSPVAGRAGTHGVQALLDEHFPTLGNWVGLSLGWVTVHWLTPILSQASYRLNHVNPGRRTRLRSLRSGTGPRIHTLNLSDYHLAGGWRPREMIPAGAPSRRR
jgi:hypothetical protein